MGRIFGPLNDSAIFRVLVMATQDRVDRLKTQGLPFPVPQPTLALIDTGASNSCIDLSLVAALGLDPSNQVPVVTPSTQGKPFLLLAYDASIVFGDGAPDSRIYTREIIATELMDQGFGLLIGRDILSRCVLKWDGPNGMFELNF